MKTTLLLALLLSASFQFSFAQTTDSLNGKLTGQWVIESVKFKTPVDLNKDGTKSADAINEYTDCQKDYLMELSEDMTARVATGTRVKDCKKEETPYTWKVVYKQIRDERYENGRRIVNDHMVPVLVLKKVSGGGGRMVRIIDVSKKLLTVRMELNDGSDSTSEAEVIYKKSKK